MGKQATLQTLIEPVVSAMAYELVGIEFLAQGRHSILRVYIDKPEGITLDDCSLVSNQLSAMLDVEDPIRGEYNLEVSSPGLDRPLFTLEQYNRFTGQECRVKMKMPIDGQRNFKGIIHSVSDNEIVLAVDDKTVSLPFDLVDKANLVPQF